MSWPTGSAIKANASRRSASARAPKVATAAASADSGPGAASAACDKAAISDCASAATNSATRSILEGKYR